MTTNRLEAFSDGVLAIIITIMVLGISVPTGADFESLRPLIPKMISYVLSFVYVGIYWNNHHHLFQIVEKVNGKILWANLSLLFSLSLIPFTTAWMGENHLAKNPVALYGINLMVCAIAFAILVKLAMKNEGQDSKLRKSINNIKKEYTSIALYLIGISLSFYLPILGVAVFFVVALIWLIPDRRIEKKSK